MVPLRHTLLSDGTSDANLIPIINWTLREAAGVDLAVGIRADFWRLPRPPQSLADRIQCAIKLFPCDVLFVHRDAERQQPQNRHAEIHTAVQEAMSAGCNVPTVAVVPVRMMEAWLCFNEQAIRRASGNPNGHDLLNLPALNKVEDCPDPKSDLQSALIDASGFKGRRRKKFNSSQAVWRIVDFIDDFSPLRQLSAFRAFEENIKHAKVNAWQPDFYGLSDRI